MPGNWNPFKPKTADDYADDVRREMNEPPKQFVTGMPPDPTAAIRGLGNYVSKSLGGPSLDPAFDALDLYSSVRTLGAKSPTALGRPAPVSARVKAASYGVQNPLLSGLKAAIVGPPPAKPKPYQPTKNEAALLRGMMREKTAPQRLATKQTQPMMY